MVRKCMDVETVVAWLNHMQMSMNSDESESEEMYECGIAGCEKKFFNEHIGMELVVRRCYIPGV